ncbi:hypothetical protein [Alkalimonas mucilaginosa]|uniref:PEP-CTERM protein-sorting domain-containing protein n=1 Tax=Alkalimonas mucilaginosa TaxID=3057676 RepID=A0ABU7JE30_9GAMM|nr:hypothetical protein [Alkalimonas sp. MEB004]MEE2023959.1 hypothetical protein [Alkalimonas sp. MEB004]
MFILSAFFHGNLVAAVISISTSHHEVYVGDTVEMSFMISGLDSNAGNSLSGFDVDIYFDSAVFGFVGVSFSDPGYGNQLDLPGEATAWDFESGYSVLSPGILDIYALSGNSASYLDHHQQSEFRFLSITFEAMMPAIDTVLELDIWDPDLLFINSWFGDLAVTMDVFSLQLSVLERTVTVAEPGTFSITATCLLLLLMLRTQSFKRYGGIQ